MKSLFLFPAMLSVSFLISLPAFASVRYSDVPNNHWDSAYDYLDRLNDFGIIYGYPDGTFRGNRSVTRYEMAVAITRLYEHLLNVMDEEEGVLPCPGCYLEDIRTPEGTLLDLTGVPDNHWAYNEISRLETMGLVCGLPGEDFRGDQPATRAELIAYIDRLSAMLDFALWGQVSLPERDFLMSLVEGDIMYGAAKNESFQPTDVADDFWALPAMQRLNEEGDLCCGYPDGSIRADRSFSRYELAMVLMRIEDGFISRIDEVTE